MATKGRSRNLPWSDRRGERRKGRHPENHRQCIGMTGEDSRWEHIAQVAFSGRRNFWPYKADDSSSGIIGHFGLGFYSAFMVSDKQYRHPVLPARQRSRAVGAKTAWV